MENQLELLGPFEQDEHKKIMTLLMEFFNNNLPKVIYWLTEPNPHLGCVPLAMLKLNRSAKLLAFIEARVEENKR